MDLADSPDAMPVSSQTLIVKPENQAVISRSNGSRNIRFHIPDYIGYFLPSQSNFNCNITMSGRGCPIPSRTSGFHSLFNIVRTHDGTGTHLLEEVLQYNTLVGQEFLHTRQQGLDAHRAEYEGLQQNDSCEDNLYWSLAGGTSWSGGDVVLPPVARNVQFLSPLHTKLYDTSQYIPCEAIGGLRLELQLDNYLRSLEYTTGSLGIGKANEVPMYPLAIINDNSSLAAVGAEPAVPLFLYTTPGSGYVQNNIYTFSIGGNIGGFVKVLNAGGTVTEASIFCLGAPGATTDVPQPVAGDVLTLGVDVAPSSAATLTVNDGILAIGDGAVANNYQNLRIPLWAENGASTMTNLAAKSVSLGGAGSVAISGLTTAFGADTLRDPFRTPTPRSTTAYNPTGCFPNCRMPFSVGDRLIYEDSFSGEVFKIGCVAGISEYGTASTPSGMPQLLVRPDKELQTGVANAQPATKNPNASVWNPGNPQANTHELYGMGVYVNDADRVSGWKPTQIPNTADFATLFSAAELQVDFKISDFQYQVKQMDMPESVVSRNLASANSGAGLQIDLETTQTSFVNVAQIQGPTSQLLSIPNITRALGCLSVPLNQNEQRGLQYKSLVGIPDNMSSYQYDLGTFGLVPSRPVNVEKASLGNPLVQTQAVNEKMKACDSFGYAVNNLNQVGMNFSVGRQFARPSMWFNLMEAGDLILNAQYDVAQTSPKLFVHFINHLRSINISNSGMTIMN